MLNKKGISLDEKVKKLSTEQQIYVKGLIDGALLHATTCADGGSLTTDNHCSLTR